MIPSTLGHRQTRQREAILHVIHEARGPLSVKNILKRAQKGQNGRLGIATVYRTINLLLEAKQIQSVILADGETLYEASGLGHHDHFKCRYCHNVFDLSVCPLHLASGTIIPGGFLVEDHDMTLYGLCPDCAKLKLKSKKLHNTSSCRA